MASTNISDNSSMTLEANTDSSSTLTAEPVLNISLNEKLEIAWGAVILQKAGTILAEFEAIDEAAVVLFVNRGKLSVSINGKPFTASKGQALIIMPGEKCVGTEPHPTDLHCQWLSFGVKHSNRRSKSGTIRVSRVSSVIDPEIVSELLRLIKEEFHRYHASNPNTRLCNLGTSLLLLSVLFRLQPTEFDKPRVSNSLSLIAERARDYMRANAAKSFTIADVAHILDCSPGYLRTAFRRTYGYSPNTFLTNTRMHNARYLLIHSRVTINAISEKCGYSSSGYFARVFTRENGVNPSQYRITHSRQYMTAGI